MTLKMELRHTPWWAAKMAPGTQSPASTSRNGQPCSSSPH